MQKLTAQEQKIYTYLKEHRGATTHDMTRDTFVQKPCARLVGLQSKGVEIEVIGEVKYPGTRPFKKYAIKTPLTKKVSTIQIINGVAHEKWEEVAV